MSATTALHRELARRLPGWRRQAGAARWELPDSAFDEALSRSIAKRFGDEPAPAAEVRRYVDGLHLEDLALAAACRAGSNAAWQHLMTELRPKLYAAARAVARDEGLARELADPLWADLYGSEERDGRRRSLLDYFHGRSRLTTWARSVLSQRLVDHHRRSKRTTPLTEGVSARAAAPETRHVEPGLARWVGLLREVLGRLLAALDPKDRLRLAAYYLEGKVLADVGRALGEHESTVSRNLERTRKRLRKDTDRALAREHELSPEQIREAWKAACDVGGLGLGEDLSQIDPQEIPTSSVPLTESDP